MSESDLDSMQLQSMQIGLGFFRVLKVILKS